MEPRPEPRPRRRSSIFSIEHRPQDAGRSSISCQLERTSSTALHQANGNTHKAFENTYKLEPDRRFDVKKAKEIVDTILDENFEDVVYDPVGMGSQCKKVSQMIKNGLKNMKFQRYKFVCSVTIGQSKNQGIRMASRYLWDAKRDTWLNATYSNHSLFVVATVFAMYYE